MDRDAPHPDVLSRGGRLHSYDEKVFALVLGQLLCQLREARGLTQRQFAAEVGLSQSALSRTESGQTRPTVFGLSRFAAAMGRSPEELRAVTDRASTEFQRAVRSLTQANDDEAALAELRRHAGPRGESALACYAVAVALKQITGDARPVGSAAAAASR